MAVALAERELASPRDPWAAMPALDRMRGSSRAGQVQGADDRAVSRDDQPYPAAFG